MTSSKQRWYAPAGRYGVARETFSRIAVTGLPGLLILISTLAACTTLQVRAGGKRPNPEVLEKTLRPGESTPADVLAALGEPDGKGREMLPVGRTPRTLWSYYYEEGSLENMGLVINKLKDSRRIFLFVFFDQDRYDGYMWFSSLPK